MNKTSSTLLGPLAAALFLSGCSLMPAYERPAAPVPAQWPARAGAAGQAGGAATGGRGLPPRPGLGARLLGLLRDALREKPSSLLRIYMAYPQSGPWRILRTERQIAAHPG